LSDKEPETVETASGSLFKMLMGPKLMDATS